MNTKALHSEMFVGLMLTAPLCLLYLPYAGYKISAAFNDGAAQGQISARSLVAPQFLSAFDVVSQNIISTGCVNETIEYDSKQNKPELSRFLVSEKSLNERYQNGRSIWEKCFNNQVALLSITTTPEQIDGLRAISARIASSPN